MLAPAPPRVCPAPDEEGVGGTFAEAIVIVFEYRLTSTAAEGTPGIATVEAVAVARPAETTTGLGVGLGESRTIALARSIRAVRTSDVPGPPAAADPESGSAVARLDTGQIASRAIGDGRNGRSLRGGDTHVSIHPRVVFVTDRRPTRAGAVRPAALIVGSLLLILMDRF